MDVRIVPFNTCISYFEITRTMAPWNLLRTLYMVNILGAGSAVRCPHCFPEHDLGPVCQPRLLAQGAALPPPAALRPPPAVRRRQAAASSPLPHPRCHRAC